MKGRVCREKLRAQTQDTLLACIVYVLIKKGCFIL